MRVEVVVGVPCPEEVDEATVLGVVPYGDCSHRGQSSWPLLL
jgi:hypothetical protein